MALPASYTESTLTAFLETELTPVLAPLGLDASDAISEAVNEVVGLLSPTALADETDVLKVRTLARWQGWLAALNAASLNTDLVAGSASIKDSQGFAQIEKLLARYERAALRYPEAAAFINGGAEAVVSGMATAGSPYGYRPWNEWGY
jgi:hypothetical protein